MKDKNQDRLDFILELFDSVKWGDSGPFVLLKPDDEKYIWKKSLLEAIDKKLEQRMKNPH